MSQPRSGAARSWFARLGRLFLFVLAAGFALGATWLTTSAGPAQATRTITYPVPSGEPQGSAFKVKVRSLGGRWRPVQTYRAMVDYYNPAPASMVEFDATGPVEISVTARQGTFHDAVVRPSALGIHPTISADGATATFTLTHPEDVSFEPNGDVRHNLQVFVNQIQRPAPTPKARRTISFRRGLHVLGGDHVLRVPPNTVVNIEGGAVLAGFLQITGDNVTIEGHGVIDPGRFYNPQGARPTIFISNARNVGVRDVTILGSNQVGVEVRNSARVVISHIREISSVRFSDGIDVAASSEVLIVGCFLRTSDDSVAIYATTPWGASGNTSNVTVRDSTLFPDVAHPVLIGTHGNPDGHNTIQHLLFSNLHLLDQNVPNPVYQGSLAVDAGDRNTVSDVRFENIDVEHITDGQLFNVRVFRNPNYNTQPGDSVRDVSFVNVSYDGGSDSPSQIEGYDPSRTVSNVTFENVRRDGKLVLTPELGNIDIGSYTSAVAFQPALPVTSLNDSSGAIRYSGSWQFRPAHGPSQATVRTASTSRSAAQVSFDGSQARLYGELGPARGIATVQVDGGPQVTIDTYAPVEAHAQLWFDTGQLQSGHHTITVRVTGARDALAQDAEVSLDRIDVVP